MEINQIKVDSLVPRSLSGGKFSPRFFAVFSRHDKAMQKRFERARTRKTVLRYVGILDKGRASAGLKEFPLHHPIAGIKSGDNIIAFTTKRYAKTPLVVQGPGAGAEVTAMGVFSDILKLLNYLPH